MNGSIRSWLIGPTGIAALGRAAILGDQWNIRRPLSSQAHEGATLSRSSSKIGGSLSSRWTRSPCHSEQNRRLDHRSSIPWKKEPMPNNRVVRCLPTAPSMSMRLLWMPISLEVDPANGSTKSNEDRLESAKRWILGGQSVRRSLSWCRQSCWLLATS